ncbi:MAG: MotA/TolQ/ExbB proton channel family protein [Gloeobacteraceae cyanobacterium ES-bin-144]|nr:MotA/TolQ/ExbB proton channel family protein [Verrucomicrobiales bacterium]
MIEILHHQLAITSPGSLQDSFDFFHKGGKFMIPLAITSVAGMMTIVYKLLSLSGKRVIPSQLASDVARYGELIDARKVEPVLREFEKGESALARLGAVVIKHHGKTRGEITHAVESAAKIETLHLYAGITVLDTVITIAPLLGLLGTASGLVLIFQGLGDNSDHLAIARGIAEALTTTIFGLAIAVPCVVAHGYFVRRIELLTARLETLLSDLAFACEHTNKSY